MKKIRERFSLSANKAGFILACALIPFSMINGAAQSSTVTSGTEVKDVVADLKESETIVLPPQAAGTKEPVEFHAADKEPAEKKNVYENTGKEATDFEAATPAQTKAQNAATTGTVPAESSQTQAAPAQTGVSSAQTTTIVEPPYTTTKVTTETVTTKTVTTETRTTESSITSGPGLPAEERIDGPLAPVQEKHSWDTPSTKNAPASPKANAQEKKDSEKKQEPEANLKIKETEPKKKPAAAKEPAKVPAKQPAKTEAKPAAPKQPAQNTKPAAKEPAKQPAKAQTQSPAQRQSSGSGNTARPATTSPATGNSASSAPVAKPAPVPTEKEASPAPKASQSEQKAKTPVPAEDEKPSRSVTVKNSQYLDVIYPGSGWIYLGEKDANDLMRYYGRKVSPDGEETKFTLKATKSGSTVLHFYKNDALAGKFIEDYLAVSVSTETERDTHVSAPNYADYVPKGQRGKNLPAEEAAPKATEAVTERPAQAESKSSPKIVASSSTGTSIERSSGSASQIQEQRPASQNQAANVASGDLLKKAQQEYDAKQYAECLATIQEFYKNADESKMDQALYLEARALEAPSPSRNIKSALHTYQTLVNRYPQSSLWEAANNRITYIQRMYIDIR
ncbi:MAG: hypothetical protein IIT57_11815 [Treponema sp.]|nr:hypothetical protein [Treponema sp.]